jgi:hypothetical protein
MKLLTNNACFHRLSVAALTWFLAVASCASLGDPDGKPLCEEDCNDGFDCTTDECINGECVNTPQDELCDDGVACTTDQCVDGTCLFTPNHDQCESGACNPTNGCAECSTDAQCDDGVACTVDSCADGTCQSAVDPEGCSEGLTCNPDVGCIGCATNEDCDDNVACTTDTCGADHACSNTPSNGACSAEGTTCHQSLGCIECVQDSDCDDGHFCNGTESCGNDGMCHDDTDFACDDQISCTANGCDEEQDQCVYTPQPDACNSGQACDPLLGCTASAVAYANSSTTLYRVELASSVPVVTSIGTFGRPITDIVEAPDGTVYGISFTHFCEINAQTGQASLSFALGFGNMNGLTMAPTGEFYFGSKSVVVGNYGTNGSLYRLIVSGSGGLQGPVEHVGQFGTTTGANAMSSSGDIVWGPYGAIYVTDRQPSGPDRLLSVNPLTGEATVQGTTNHQEIYGLSFVNGRLIGFTGPTGADAGEIIEIDPLTGASVSIHQTPGILWWGAS